jgi:hypothetical protein
MPAGPHDLTRVRYRRVRAMRPLWSGFHGFGGTAAIFGCDERAGKAARGRPQPGRVPRADTFPGARRGHAHAAPSGVQRRRRAGGAGWAAAGGGLGVARPARTSAELCRTLSAGRCWRSLPQSRGRHGVTITCTGGRQAGDPPVVAASPPYREVPALGHARSAAPSCRPSPPTLRRSIPPVNGHWEIRVGGLVFSGLAATRFPGWWPRFSRRAGVR